MFPWVTEEAEGPSALIKDPPALVVVTYDVKHQNPLHIEEHPLGVGILFSGGAFDRGLA